jgi:hypothetical protein
MKTVSVTIGMLLVGAAIALAGCGDDDSGTGGAGASGGTGGSGGAGGSAGSTGGSSGSSQDSGVDQGSGGSSGGAGAAGSGGSGGAAGSGGKAGSSGAAGNGGSAGSSGASGSAGSAGKDGGTGGSAGSGPDASSDGGQCPATQPIPATACADDVDCVYGPVTCTCLDPGPDGLWACVGDPDAGNVGDSSGICPAESPIQEDCPDSGPAGPCIYEQGHLVCRCLAGATTWVCERH